MRINLNKKVFKERLEWTRASGIWYCRNSLFVIKVGKGKTRREAFQNLQRMLNLYHDGEQRWFRNNDDKFRSQQRRVKKKQKELAWRLDKFKKYKRREKL